MEGEPGKLKDRLVVSHDADRDEEVVNYTGSVNPAEPESP